MVALAICAALPAFAGASELSRLPGPNGTVYAITPPDASGTRYLGGEFTAFNPWATGYATRVDPATAEVDTTFPVVMKSGGGGSIRSSAPDGEGGFYIGGMFDTVGGLPRSNAAHIMADGSVDPDWDPVLDGNVATIGVAGSTVYIGGSFETVDGTSRRKLAALGADGSLLPWNPSIRGGGVNALKIDGGTLYVVGYFDCIGYNGDDDCEDTGETVRNSAAAFDISSGERTLKDWNPDLGYSAEGIDTSGTRAYIVGQFSSAGGETTTEGIAVDKTSGALIPEWSVDSNLAILTVAVRGSTVYVGGFGGFYGTDSTGDATTRAHAEAVDATTGDVLPWDPNPSFYVYTLKPYGSSIYIGGFFDSVGKRPRAGAARVDPVTGAVDSWDPGCPPDAYTISPTSSSVFIGGSFTSAGGTKRAKLAAVDAAGGLTSWSPSVSELPVFDIAVDGSNVYAVGAFTEVNGESHRRVAKISAATGEVSAWAPATPLNGDAYSVAVKDSRVYIGGHFSSPRNRSAAFSAADATLLAWNPGTDADVRDIVPDGTSVYLAGDFTSPAGRLAEVDATSGASTGWDPELDNRAYSIALSGGSIYAGGEFLMVGSDIRMRVARISRATGLADSWNPEVNNRVRTLALADGKLYVGGDFNLVHTETTTATRNRAAAVDADGTITAWNPNADNIVRVIQPAGGDALIGGSFKVLGSTERNFVAKIGLTGAGTLAPPWPNVPAAASHPLAITKGGSGSGTVSSSPEGISCGADCWKLFASGTSVTLTATPADGSTFSGWSGGGCSGDGPCTLTMDEARSVTATFEPGSGPSPGPGPGPGPGPDPAERVVTRSIRSNSREIITRIRVPGAGRISQVGIRRAMTARTRVACTASKTVNRAGTVTLKCRLNSATRKARRKGAVRVRVTTRFRPVSGAAQATTRMVVLRSLKPRYTG